MVIRIFVGLLEGILSLFYEHGSELYYDLPFFVSMLYETIYHLFKKKNQIIVDFRTICSPPIRHWKTRGYPTVLLFLQIAKKKLTIGAHCTKNNMF